MLSPKDFQELYMSVYEGMDPEERALKRELAADKRASKMDSNVGARYASSEGRSAARADKKSKGKHIHGTVDEAFVDPEQGEAPSGRSPLSNVSDHPNPKVRKKAVKAFKNQMSKEYGGTWKSRSSDPVSEAKVDKGLPEHERSAARLKRYANPSGALALGGGQQRARRAEHEERRGVKKEELEMQLRAHLRERALDAAEKKEKESVYKAIKPSKLAKTYPEKSPEELKSLRYAISTAQAKKNMDTSRSDKRYGVER